MKPSFYTFNAPGYLCRCRCDDNHPSENVCEGDPDEDLSGVCYQCAILLRPDRETVIRDLVGVLEGTRSNAHELKARL